MSQSFYYVGKVAWVGPIVTFGKANSKRRSFVVLEETPPSASRPQGALFDLLDFDPSQTQSCERLTEADLGKVVVVRFMPDAHSWDGGGEVRWFGSLRALYIQRLTEKTQTPQGGQGVNHGASVERAQVPPANGAPQRPPEQPRTTQNGTAPQQGPQVAQEATEEEYPF